MLSRCVVEAPVELLFETPQISCGDLARQRMIDAEDARRLVVRRFAQSSQNVWPQGTHAVLRLRTRHPGHSCARGGGLWAQRRVSTRRVRVSEFCSSRAATLLGSRVSVSQTLNKRFLARGKQ